MKVLLLTTVCGLLFIFNSSCSKKSTDAAAAAANPVPSLVTIAKGALPSVLESSSVTLLDSKSQAKPFNTFTVDTNLTELQTRMFSPGPTDFLYRLSMVDSRLAEIAQNLTDCESTGTTTYTPPVVATGFAFPMEFSCSTTIDASSQGIGDYEIYYGKSGGYWYLGEFQSNSGFATADAEPPSLAVLAKVSDDGNDMEVYQISVENPSSTNYYASVTHILADKANSVFEVSTGSSATITQTISPGANMTGLGCGVQMKTDNTLVYAAGIFSQDATCPSSATVCALATDLSTTTGCGSTLTSFTSLAMTRASISGTNAKSMIIDRTGLPTF